MNHEALNLEEKFSGFSEHWSPRVIVEMNDYQFKLVKAQGEFVWHSHTDTDETSSSGMGKSGWNPGKCLSFQRASNTGRLPGMSAD